MSASPDGGKRPTAGILGRILSGEISLAEAAGRVADLPSLRWSGDA